MISSTFENGVPVLCLARPDRRNALEAIAQSLLVQTDDHAEGLQAARGNRSPSFGGR